MKRLLLALVVSTFSASVAAEWKKVLILMPDSTQDIYIDLDTVRRNGDVVKVWELRDIKNREGDTRSIRARREYDCVDERARTLFFSVYNAQMGTGEPSATDDRAGEWKSLHPGSDLSWVLSFVCSLQPK